MQLGGSTARLIVVIAFGFFAIVSDSNALVFAGFLLVTVVKPWSVVEAGERMVELSL